MAFNPQASWSQKSCPEQIIMTIGTINKRLRRTTLKARKEEDKSFACSHSVQKQNIFLNHLLARHASFLLCLLIRITAQGGSKLQGKLSGKGGGAGLTL